MSVGEISSGASGDLIRRIEEIMEPGWTYGMILPRYVGAEDDARICAIRKAIGEYDAQLRE